MGERHVCLLYETEAERRAGLLAFVRDGFAEGDRLARVRAEVARGTDLEVDLSDLRFIDVSGLWVLYDAAVQLGKQGKRVTLVTAPPSVIRMLAVLGWHEVEGLRVEPQAV